MDKKQKEIVKIVVPLFILGIISFIFDQKVVELFQDFQNSFLDKLFNFFSSTFFIGGFLILILIIMYIIKKDHRWIAPLITSVVLTFIVIYLLKFLVARGRPLGNELQILGLMDYSFPSYHTAYIFSMIPILGRSFKNLKVAWIIIGVLMGLSRLYLGVHYLSDVIFGALIALIISEVVAYLEEDKRWFSSKIKIWR
ncbi:hypothetical protein BVX95_00235 [archaeon D22]|nr:hypothetical protein BVX95_00235 [archaeon D22]